MDGLAIDADDDVANSQYALRGHTVDGALDSGALTGDRHLVAGRSQRHDRGDGLALVDQSLVGCVDLFLRGTGRADVDGWHDLGPTGDSCVGHLAPVGF